SDPPSTETYTLSLHDALPILLVEGEGQVSGHDHRALVLVGQVEGLGGHVEGLLDGAGRKNDARRVAVGAVQQRPHVALLVLGGQDRKSTRLNSSHVKISYAVF